MQGAWRRGGMAGECAEKNGWEPKMLCGVGENLESAEISTYKLASAASLRYGASALEHLNTCRLSPPLD